jgi:L-glyceraldehyde 3-phosphate reductase
MNYQPAEDRYNGQMSYTCCGKSGLLLPRISLGLWHNFGDVDDQQTARDMLLYAFDHGITHFDLANNYGPAPEVQNVTSAKYFMKILLVIVTK